MRHKRTQTDQQEYLGRVVELKFGFVSDPESSFEPCDAASPPDVRYHLEDQLPI
jgi:hypothetical protein